MKMRPRQAIKEAEARWGENFHLESYRCLKVGCKHKGCSGPGAGAIPHWHYEVGVYTEPSGILPKATIIKGEGPSWRDALEKARA